MPAGAGRMTGAKPTVTHTYQNHTLDSTRWQRYRPRDDDIIVATSLKSGTTWMQAILAHLILGVEATPSIGSVSPWLEVRWGNLDQMLEGLEAQQHRRFIKTHLPLDGLPFYPQVRYILVGRDARDVFMSLWNHHSMHTYEALAVQDSPGFVGAPMERFGDIHVFWRSWIARGWFAWESDGYPYWGNLHHTQTWWRHRGLENILFVHYNDLLGDLPSEIRRIAGYLDTEISNQRIAEIARAVSFASMKQNADTIMPAAHLTWHGGAQTFINKGTNGRWKDVLSTEELALYGEAVTSVLEPECAAWLERGRAALQLPTGPLRQVSAASSQLQADSKVETDVKPAWANRG